MNQQLFLYPYQLKAVSWLSNKERAILGSEMGTGKSAIAIAAADSVLGDSVLRCLIICPAIIKGVWEKEIPKWLPPERAKVQVIQSGKDTIDPNARWVIVTYDLFQKLSFKINPAVVIVDECHYCKNPRTKRTKAVLGKDSIARRAARVWLLTGTPFPNNLIDCWSPFSFCAYYRLGKYWEFAEKYCYVRETLWGKRATGSRNLKELTAAVRPFLYRDTVKEVLSELPDYQEEIVPLEHSSHSQELNAELNQYQDAVKKTILTGERSPDAPHISTLRRELGIEKIQQAVDFIKNLLDQELQVVVFAHHIQVIAGIVQELSRSILISRIGCITGDTPVSDRTELIKGFQAGAKKCLILSIKAGGVGITLTNARVAVFVEEDWTPAGMEQAKARIRRIGQKNFCTYYYLHFPNSLDEVVHEAVKTKDRDINKFWTTWEGNEGEEEQIQWD